MRLYAKKTDGIKKAIMAQRKQSVINPLAAQVLDRTQAKAQPRITVEKLKPNGGLPQIQLYNQKLNRKAKELGKVADLGLLHGNTTSDHLASSFSSK
jgi:hypothetical protein